MIAEVDQEDLVLLCKDIGYAHPVVEHAEEAVEDEDRKAFAELFGVELYCIHNLKMANFAMLEGRTPQSFSISALPERKNVKIKKGNCQDHFRF